MVKKTRTVKSSNFFKKLAEQIDNSHMLEEAVGTAEFTGTIDTGCLILNGLVSGSLFGGIQNNKTITLAGDPSTGKTFIALSILCEYLKNNPDAGALHMDTESAVTTEMARNRGIDVARVIQNEPITVEDFRDVVIDTLKAYGAEEEAPPLMMILDSLGQLSTRHEIGIAEEKKDTKDMTRERLIKAAFRLVRRRLAEAKVPMIVTNHIYTAQGGYGPSKVISGGSGLLYTADTILMLTKAKEEDKSGSKMYEKSKEYSGVILTVTTYKSRLTRENKSIKLRVSYTSGLDRYYGLLPLAEKYGIFRKESQRYVLPDGRKVFGKEINDNPEDVYTQDILKQLDEAARKEFCYGQGEGPSPEVSLDADVTPEIEETVD